jgi:lipopolysaccharide/colanic/teichoic acid biosynthesis glycosyltransferase/glycosyltransferase involved in cell wall biosynthesis
MPRDVRDSRVRVAHVTTVDLSLRYLLLNQLVDLKNHGFDVTGISASGPDVAAIEQAGIVHVPVGLTRRMAPLQDVRAFADLYRVFRRHRFDIVHTHNPKPGLFGQFAARLAGVPIVVNTIHGLYGDDRTRPWRRRLYLMAERLAARASDAILSQSREDVDTIVRERVAAADAVVHLGNGIDLTRFDRAGVDRAAIDERRKEFGFEPGDRIVGFVGRLVAEKGLCELLTAMRSVVERVPTARLLVVGPPDTSKPDALSPSTAEALGVGRFCRFVGLQTDMPAVYALMDVFVLPSHREGVPRSPMEASAMRVPCIVTDVRGCREVVDAGTTGIIVPPRDAPALADAIVRVLTDRQLASRLGDGARTVACERFDERRVFEIVRREYGRLLATKALGRTRETVGQSASGTWYRRWGKRVVDVATAGLMLVMLSPVFAIVTLLVWLSLGRPILFRQLRPGLRERPFTIFKFRTMTGATRPDGQPRPDAERLTRVGRWLRSLTLDELPELFNVLRGEMSMVGPRPLLMQYVTRYSPDQRRRHLVKPGLTGWAQVNGRNAVGWPEKFRLDLWYVDHVSWQLDLKILLLSIPTVLGREGVAQPGRSTSDEFMGGDR